MKKHKWIIPLRFLYMILISLLIMLLTWSWFERKIRDIDAKIETLQKH